MQGYKCASCGKVFDPSRKEFCPGCGTAVAPSVLTRIERKKTAQRLRAEGMRDYADNCHEDDAWSDSYGASTHRAAVRSHETNLRATYAAHRPADEPTRPVNTGSSRPVNASASSAANTVSAPYNAQNQSVSSNPTRLSNANPAANPMAQNRNYRKQKKSNSGWGWIVIIWFIYMMLRVLFGILGELLHL